MHLISVLLFDNIPSSIKKKILDLGKALLNVHIQQDVKKTNANV